jgi:hypothetical protein
VILKIMPNRHPHEDVFEDYAFDRLSGNDAGKFEEHLLICEECQGTLAKTEEYILVMKTATAGYASERTASSLTRRSPGLRRNAAAAAILLLTCLTALLSWRTPTEPVVIVLDAYRGAATSKAPAAQPLDLKIDIKDVRPSPAYRVEVVDSTGRRVWFGGTPARINNGLPKGDYWVRLLTDSGELLREYGLAVADSLQ